MKKSKSTICRPHMTNFCDIIKANIHLFTPLPNDKKIFNILKTLAIQNFGDIQFKTILSKKTLIADISIAEAIQNKTVNCFLIKTSSMYLVSDFTQMIFNTYNGKIKRGVYDVHSKKKL